MNLPSVFTTKSELARRHIQDLILSGAVRAGDRLKSREVSEMLGISETPIREAIRALASEGWLEMTTHVGAVVQKIRPEQVHEVSSLRGLISALAIELNGPAFDEAMLDRLVVNVEEMAAFVAARNLKGFAETNDVFHSMLCDGPCSPWCAKILGSMLGLTSFQRHGIPPRQERLEEAVREHRKILEYLRARDFRAAAEMVRIHEVNAGLSLIRALEEAEASDAAAAPY